MDNIYNLSVDNNENIILDATIINVSLNIYSMKEPEQIKILLQSICKGKKRYLLSFNDVKEFIFVGDELGASTYVERYNFFIWDGFYYITLDPYDEYNQKPHDRDNFVIVAKNVSRESIDA